MGANPSHHPATTSPIPEYSYGGRPQQQYGPQQYGPPQAQYGPPASQYRAANPYGQASFDPFEQGYDQAARTRIGDANAYFGDGGAGGPPAGYPPRGPMRGPGGPRGPGPRGPPRGPPRTQGGNDYARSNRPLPSVISDALDDDDIFAVEQDMFRSRPPRQKQNPFGEFDPFANYNRRRADAGPTYDGQQISYGGDQGVIPQRAQEYRSPPQPQYFHVQPPPGQDSTHVFHYDPATGTLATNDGHSRVTQLPQGYGYSGGYPQVISGGQGFPFNQGY